MNISRYRESLKKKGLYFCIQEVSKYLFPIRWVSDKKLMDEIYHRRAYRYLERKYSRELHSFTPAPSAGNAPSRIIWTAWFQGEENAPAIVKSCISSMRRYASDYEVRVITRDNLESFVSIPGCVTKALKKHRMQFAQFSDYVRISLLEKYGGIWIDSTVLLTGAIPEKALCSPLFFFQAPPVGISIIRNSSWFISAQPLNPFIQKIKYLLDCYWMRERHLCDYFLLHLLMAMVSRHDALSRCEWAAVPYSNNADVHRMQSLLFEPYTSVLFDELCSLSSVHKLSYKLDSGKRTEGTLFEFISGLC